MRLKDKTALVTGAGTGLGEAIALMFAREGARVALCGRRAEPLQKVLAEMTAAGGQGVVVPGDMTREADAKRAVADTMRHFGRLDILVNNAGAIVGRGSVSDSTEEGLRGTFEGNVVSTFLCAKHALPELIKTRGNIVNMASLAGLRGTPNMAAYGAAKGAVVVLTKGMALDYAAHGVRVNCICPAYIETDINREHLARMKKAGQYEAIVKSMPLGFMGEPKDVAYGAVYLASEEARWVSGIALNLDGGITAGR
jgi:NAD(P)-dependent dehydrogenase (short-subunit alcohol dehydrogenase family)